MVPRPGCRSQRSFMESSVPILFEFVRHLEKCFLKTWFGHEELLQSQAVQSALQMGFSAEEISQTVERKAHLSGERYRSVEALVTDLISAQRDNTPSAHLENHLQKDLSTEEKLKRLEEDKICRICMDKLLSIVFIPCGHLACQECAEAVEKCPWCCKVIAHRQKVFMP